MRIPARRRLLAPATLAALAGLASLSCADSTGPRSIPVVRVKPQWVSGEAAAALDSASGLIRIAVPAAEHISLLSADSIAAAALHLLLTPSPINTTPAQLEYDRGGSIDFSHLSVCAASTTYSLSPFGAFPASASAAARRSWSSRWAIPICGADGTVQVSIGVPDSPTDAIVDHDTLVGFATQGEEFDDAGVPARYPTGQPVTAEQAIAALFAATGRRISTTPVAVNQLDDRGFGQLPLCASWRMSLESPVVVVDEQSGARSTATEFFVRRATACYSDTLALYIAAPNQPATMWRYIDFALDSAEVPLVGPVRFERVTIVP